jgi:hypothetical protein
LKPDIIAITEVYPKSNNNTQSVELQIEDFDCFISGNTNGRGVCIYTRKNLKAKIVEDLTNSNFEESVWCEIVLDDDDSLLIGCIYRSPSSPNMNNKKLLELLNQACNRNNAQLLVVGDFNFPEIDWETWTSSVADTHISAMFIDCLQDNYLFQHTNIDTRHRIGQRSNLLDLIITNAESMITEVRGGSPLGKSDHVVLNFSMDCYAEVSQADPNGRYMYDKGDYEKLRLDLKSIDWEGELKSRKANDAWNFFETKFKVAIEKNIPKTKPKTRDSAPKFKPLWMNKIAMKKVKMKYNAWKRYTRTKQYQDYENYIKARNDATKEVRKAKKKYERNLAEEVKNNPKAFWKYVRSKTKVKTGIKDLKKDDGSYAHSDGEKAELLNAFFASVYTDEDTSHIPTPDKMHHGDNLTEINIEVDDVKKQIKKLKTSKSPGPDGLHPRALKESCEEIAEALAIIFKKSMEEGVVPDHWKIAEVTAIFKKGSAAEVGNYRPVSLTSVVCKMMESIIRDQTMSFMKENDIICEEQHGFRPGRSCVTQLLEIMDIWTQMFEEGDGIDVVYLDFRKAFDSVPHQRLMMKLRSHGIDGNLLKWIESFLLNRKQRVSVNGQKSTWEPVRSGISQGSVLGPILFIIFINDLPNMISSMVMMFADDTKVFTQVQSEDDCAKLQDDLDKLGEWSNQWQLQFNVKKCGVMHYGKSQTDRHDYSMKEGDGRRELGKLEEEKDLGVLFVRALTFTKHVGAVVNKANRVVGVTKRTFDHMDKQMFKIIYKTMIRPHLEYANCIWSPFLKGDIEKLEKVQRRATKIIPTLRNLTYTTRLKMLNLPTLAYRRLRGDLIQVYRIMHGFTDIQPQKLFIMEARVDGLRGHSYKVQKSRNKERIRQNCFSQRIVNLWNKLPGHIVNSKSTNIFKNGIDSFLSKHIDKYDYMGSTALEQVTCKVN